MVSGPDLLLAAVLVLSATVAVRANRNRTNRGASALAGFMLTLVVWEGSHLLAHQTGGWLRVLFERLEWLGIGAAPFAWLLFVFAYVGREDLVSRRTAALAAAWPLALNAVVWLSAVVDLPFVVWATLRDGSGTLFWAHILLAYGTFAVGTVLVLRFVWRARSTFRLQGIAVAAGIAAMWAGTLVTVLELFGDAHVHGAAAGLTLTGLAFLWATTRGRLTDLVPVATSTVLRTMDAGVVVTDRDDRVVEVDPTAGDLLGLASADAVVGARLADVLADTPAADAGLPALGDGDSVTVELGDRSVQVRASTLQTGRDSGRVLLFDDVTEQRRRQERLQRQNERLDAFAGVVSHDLRNPLMVARGYVAEARKTGELEVLEQAEGAHDRIETLVEDLLTLAREGQIVDDPSPVALDAVATDAWDAVETPEATLRVETDARLVADRGQLERLLENLVRNALDHGGDDATVTVGDREDGFYVADDGPGIPEGERRRVRESGVSTGDDGAGLGLAIVDGIADAHGWTMTIDESESGGARFGFAGVERPDEAEGDGGPWSG